MNKYLFRAWTHDPDSIHDGIMSYNVRIEEENTCCIDGDGAWKIGKDPSIKIMQYTGAEDANGKPIYEGDIISATHPSTDEYPEYTTFGEVKIKDLFRGAIIENSKHGNNHGLNQYSKVIGNIYEDPELLHRIRRTT